MKEEWKEVKGFEGVFKDDYIKKIVEDPMEYNNIILCGTTNDNRSIEEVQ